MKTRRHRNSKGARQVKQGTSARMTLAHVQKEVADLDAMRALLDRYTNAEAEGFDQAICKRREVIIGAFMREEISRFGMGASSRATPRMED